MAGALWFRSLFDGEAWSRDVAVHVGPDGRIATMRAGVPAPADAMCFEGRAAPGFIDLQVNGAGGVAFNDAPGVEAVRRVAATLRGLGVCHFLPTVITDAPAVFTAMRDAVDAARPACPEALGVHYEGPFIDLAFRGIHPETHVRPWTGVDEVVAWRTQGADLITLAPEHVPSRDIAALVEAGFVVSLGHTGANFAAVEAAVQAGARGMTHFFNAMSPLHHRAPGAVGAGLALDALTLGLIADGHHVDDAVIDMLARRVGPARLCLVSDGMPTLGVADEAVGFTLGGRAFERRGGRLVDADGRLAGAQLSLSGAVARLVRDLGVSWDDALRMASLVPARLLGLDGQLGRLRPGHRASVTVLDDDGAPLATLVDGRA